MMTSKRCCGIPHKETEGEAVMLGASLAMEHQRLHVIEQWPDGPEKRAHLAAVSSAIGGLEQAANRECADWTCIVCGQRGVPALLRAAA